MNDYTPMDATEGLDPLMAPADPILTDYQTEDEQQNWVNELEAARKERVAFNKAGVDTISRYANSRKEGEKGKRFFNIFFANTEIKMAAMYARTPVPDIKRRFNDQDDQVSRVAANLLQRNISYELESHGFDVKFKQMLFDRLVPGLGIGWARLEQETAEGPLELNPITGEVHQGAPVTVDQQAQIDYVAWNDFHWSPCRVWPECRWVGRRVPMSKAAMKSRFGDTYGEDALHRLAFTRGRSKADTKDKTKDALAPKHSTEATIDVYELWDKERRLIFWITEGAEKPLDVQADSNEFPNFFPTPLPPMGRTTTSNTTPISDYSLVQDQYLELDDLNAKAAGLIQALQVRWVYDSSNEALKDLYTSARELEGIPVNGWASFVSEKGGIAGSMQFAPLSEIATTYQNTIQSRNAVKADIYEVEGISDLMRGAAVPYETKAASDAKMSIGITRLSSSQREVADYAQRLLRLKAHLICKFYDPKFIVARAGITAQADVQLIPQAIQLLKDASTSPFRLEVSTESIQAENWDQEKNERTQLVGVVSTFMTQVAPVIERTPQLAPLALNILKFAVAGFKGAKSIEGMVDQNLDQMMQAMQQAQANPKPPAPNPAEIKAQVAQAQMQTDLQKTQMQEETKRTVASTQAQLDAAHLQLEQQALQIKQYKAEAEAALGNAHVRVDAMNAAHTQAHDVVSLVPLGGGH